MKILKLTDAEKDTILKGIAKCLNKSTQISGLKIDIESLLTRPKTDKNKIKKPILKITSDVYNKMFSLVLKYDKEISWHCFCNKCKNDNQIEYLIDDIIVFPQINTATSTQTNQDEYADWLIKIMSDPHSRFEDLRCHGHSHVNMNVFSSGTDDAYQNDLLSNIKDDDYYIFLVLNKSNKMCVLIYDYAEGTLFETDDIIIQVLDNNGNDIFTWTEESIKKYCKTQTPISKTKNYYNNNSNYYTSSQLKIDEYLEAEEPVFPSRSKKKGKKKYGFK